MKILGCVLMLLVSSNLLAGSWTYELEEVTAASGDPGFIWTLSSKHPVHDVTMVMKLVAYQNDPYRNEPER